MTLRTHHQPFKLSTLNEQLQTTKQIKTVSDPTLIQEKLQALFTRCLSQHIHA